MTTLYTKKIVEDKHMPKPGLTIYKQHRFIEYEESDRWWVEKYGYGFYEEPKVYHIGDLLIMHPETAKLMRKVITKLL